MLASLPDVKGDLLCNITTGDILPPGGAEPIISTGDIRPSDNLLACKTSEIFINGDFLPSKRLDIGGVLFGRPVSGDLRPSIAICPD